MIRKRIICITKVSLFAVHAPRFGFIRVFFDFFPPFIAVLHFLHLFFGLASDTSSESLLHARDGFDLNLLDLRFGVNFCFCSC